MVVSKFPVEYSFSIEETLDENSRKLADMEGKKWVDPVMTVEAFYAAAESAGKKYPRDVGVFWKEYMATLFFDGVLTRSGRRPRERSMQDKVKDLQSGIHPDEAELFVLVRLARGHAQHFTFCRDLDNLL